MLLGKLQTKCEGARDGVGVCGKERSRLLSRIRKGLVTKSGCILKAG